MISTRPFSRWAWALASAWTLASSASAQVTKVTGTAGFGVPGNITQTGAMGAPQTVTIPANAGVQSGSNLFHSFSQFDVASGDMAIFTPTGSTGAINNIIARINSASASQIYGNVSVQAMGNFSAANLFLINPKGVVFGPNSSVNVPGDFVTSTSDYVTLSDGVNTGFFYADPANAGNTSLSNSIMTAPVSSFGFLKAQTLTAGITVNGGASFAQVSGSLQFVTSNFTTTGTTTLAVTKPSAPLGIFAGAQTSSSTDGLVPYLTGTVTSYSSASNITGGAINLGDSTGPATVSSAGSVVIRGGQLVQLGGMTKAAKSVLIKADSFTLTSGTVQTTGTTGTIGIDTTDSTGTVTLNTGTITSAGGSITLGASALGGLSLDSVSTITQTGGTGGTLSITSTGTITNAGTISATGSSALRISTLGLAVNGGTISTGTGALGIDATGLTALTTDTVTSKGGKITSAGGAITLGHTSLLDLTLDALSSITETAGTGRTLSITSSGIITNGGTISTSGANALAISGPAINDNGTISTVTGALGVDSTGTLALSTGTITSAGGAISLGATSLDALVIDGTSSITQTGGTNPALTIKATGTVNNSGTISTVGNEALTVTAPSLSLSGTLGAATGAVTINTTGATALTGGTILSGGAITLGNTTLGSLSLNAGSSINSTGNSVTVTLSSGGALTMTGGMIETTSIGATRAGNVRVTDASGNITLSGGAEIASIASATSSGGSGNVSINPGVGGASSSTLSITGTGVAAFSNNGATWQAAFDADAGPGVEAPNTGIYSIDNGTGSAGSVSVIATGNVTLALGGQIAALQTNAAGGNTGAVNLSMLPDAFFITNASALTVGGVTVADGMTPVPTVPIIFTSTANKASSAGAVTINALSSTIELQPGATIQTSTQDGQAGNVSVFGGAVMLDPYTDIESVETQFTGDAATTGKTGSVLVEVFNLDASNIFDPFVGPLAISSHAFIETQANPKAQGFDPVGPVQVFAGSLTEGGNVVTDTDGFDFDYKIRGFTQILAVNNANLNGANGVDVGSQNKVVVENLIGFPSSSSAPNTSPAAGNGIVLDGTLNGTDDGTHLAIPATPNTSGVGYTYLVNIGDGTQVTSSSGTNLFLSFYTFNLGFNSTGHVPEAVEFEAPGVKNIVARVTSGTASKIDGMIEEADDTNANIFLLNSAGFLFTANSGINLNGAFTLSTADSINLSAGGSFQVTGLTSLLIADDSVLTTPATRADYDGTVSGFDFAATAPKGVSISAATLSNANSGNGQIQIISGDILLGNDALLNATQTFLFATDSAGTLSFKSNNSLATFATPLTSASSLLDEQFSGELGLISLTGGSVLTVPTPNEASTILIRGQTFNLTDSLIVDQTTAENGSLAGEVLVDVAGDMTISTTNGPSFISTSALGEESGGSVIINAADLTIAGSSAATTGILSTAEPSQYYTSDAGYITFSYPGPDLVTGSAGSVTLNITHAISLSSDGQISTNTTGGGTAGTITIRGQTLTLPGNITETVLPQLTVSGGATISSSTNIDPLNLGAFTRTGNAGSVVINASALTVTGMNSEIVSSAGTALLTGPTGRGGSVDIQVNGSMGLGTGSMGDIAVTDNGLISASSFNTAFSGQVTLSQMHSTDLVDPATNPTTPGGLSVASGGSITTAENGPGSTGANSNASILQLQVQAVTVDGGSITSGTLGASAAGAIRINGAGTTLTDFVQVKNGGVISSNTGGTSGSGAGGTITVNTGALAVTGANSAISTNSTGGTGAGGSITLEVQGSASTLASTGDLLLTSGGAISASSNTTGQAGDVTITQNGSLDLVDPATHPTTNGGVYLNNGSISTAANGAGRANASQGQVMISTQGLTVSGTTGSITSSTLGASNAGSITLQGSQGQAMQFLQVTGGGSISSNTGNMVTGGTGNGGTISITSGALTVTGANSAISTSALSGSGSGGNITISARGNSAILGSTGDVKLTNGGAVSALSLTNGVAGTVTIMQRGSTDLADPATNPTVIGGLEIDGGSITTLAAGTGVPSGFNPAAGNITLTTQALTMVNGGSIISSTLGRAKAGSISVNGVSGVTQWVMIKGGSQIASNTSGTGAGGTITVNAGALTLDGASSAITTSATGSSTNTGSGGSITLNTTGSAAVAGATGDVAITNGGTVSASSTTMGDAGTVTITQAGSRDIVYPTLTATTNGGLLLNDGTITTAASGPGVANSVDTTAGDITLKTEALTITGGSLISSSTAGASKAGDVKVGGPVAGANTQFVVMQGGAQMASQTSGTGNGGTIVMNTGSLLVDGSALSTSATGGSGNGGDITITAVSATPTVDSFVTLQHGGTITSSSVSSGAAGKITIAADRTTVTGAGAAISTNAGPIGNAMNAQGRILVSGQDLFIANSGLISATTGGFSPGGSITIAASNEVDLTTNARMDASSTAQAGGANGGSILIGSNPDSPLNDIGLGSPYTVSLSDNSVISCDSSFTNGGNIGIQTDALYMDHSLISTSEPNGPTNTIGGNITVRANTTFYLNNFSFINSNAGQGTGGNITIDPQFTVLNHSGINAIGGSANGNVFILSDFVLSGTSTILATGVVDIDSLPLDLTGSLLPLPANLTDEQKRLREKCARAVNHEFSSFIVVGRGGTESAPEEFQPDFGLDSLPTRPN